MLSYGEVLDAMRYLGYQIGTEKNPRSANRRAHNAARALAGKVVASAMLPSQIAEAWAIEPKLTAEEASE